MPGLRKRPPASPASGFRLGNWTELAQYEFDLPPLEEQKRIADLLWCNERALCASKALEARMAEVVDARFDDIVRTAEEAGRILRLSEVVLHDRPITYGIVQAGPHVPDGIPYIRVSDMKVDVLSPEGMLRTSAEIAAKYHRSEVRAGEVVIALRGQIGLCRIVPSSLDGANLTQGTARIAPNEKLVLTEYLLLALDSGPIREQVAKNAKGSTFKELSLKAVRELAIPVPDLAEQVEVVSEARALRSAQGATKNETAALAALGTKLRLGLLKT